MTIHGISERGWATRSNVRQPAASVLFLPCSIRKFLWVADPRPGVSSPRSPIKAFALVLLTLALFSSLPRATADETNSPPPVKESAPKKIWDYGEELSFTPEQSAAMEKIKADYAAATEELKKPAPANTPPDLLRDVRLAYGKKIRALNAQVETLLTPEQKEKLKTLRARRTRTPAAGSGVTETKTDNPTNDLAFEQAGAARKPPRPEMSGEDRKKLADDLRRAYSKPPAEWPAPDLDETVRPNFVELALLPPVAYPANNPYTDAKAALGRELYFDPRLSGSSQIACASCHDPDLSWTDGRTVSFGHGRKELKRNAPTLLNAGQSKILFWDGRASSLEKQVADVVQNEDEMRGGEGTAVGQLEKISGYRKEFEAAFGTPEISLTRIGQAVATFERTIISRPNPFDEFLRGDTNALSDPAVRGLNLFRTTARCINCHFGPTFTDQQFHNEGLTYYGRKYEDLGRYTVTHQAEDVGRFKTPTLRNIAKTAPYMHNGLFDLEGVLNMYNAGMATVRPRPEQKDDPLFPKKSPLLKSLGLNAQDLADLKAFLESLTELRSRVRPPELPVAEN